MDSPRQDDMMIELNRVVIVGAGHVGSTAAYALMLRALVREIVLIDSDPALAEAEAADLSDANALARPGLIWAGTYADAASARISLDLRRVCVTTATSSPSMPTTTVPCALCSTS